MQHSQSMTASHQVAVSVCGKCIVHMLCHPIDDVLPKLGGQTLDRSMSLSVVTMFRSAL